MQDAALDLELAAWAAAEGRATEQERAALEADPPAWRHIVERLIGATEANLASVRRLKGPERERVVADFEDDLSRLHAAERGLRASGVTGAASASANGDLDDGAAVLLQASWSAGQVVVWAGGAAMGSTANDQLADLLEAIGGPSVGWSLHRPLVLPSGARAEALSIPVRESLMWLLDMGAAPHRDGAGASVVWLGRIAVVGVRLVARGAVVPALRNVEDAVGRSGDWAVRWVPALLDDAEIDQLAAAMPGPVVAFTPAAARATTMAVLSAVVDAIVSEAAALLELPAPPPTSRTAAAVAETFMTRLDGSSFSAPVGPAGQVSRRLDQWARSVVGPGRPQLVVRLEPPDRGDVWLLSVLGPGADGNLLPVEVALGDSRSTKRLADELVRLERLLPVLHRAGGLRRGQVALSPAEAWDLMTVTGAELEAAGFEVRVPALSRRKPTPGLRLFAQPTGGSVVGANQLSNVRWSVVFDDVELTGDDVARLAAAARPLVKARGRWVELDHVDLEEAAAALAERATTRQLTGAEVLRYGVGLEGNGLARRVTLAGSGWAADVFGRARLTPEAPVTHIDGFEGELRSYQAEALSWLGFLDDAELGGCLALDMGLGKTPTVLAHVARTIGDGPVLVVAPAAVVGNWAAEAARFTPTLRVMVHHGTTRASADELAAEVAGADVVITTYGTAVRDIDAVAGVSWSRLVLDEAQAVKNPTSETAQQLRRIRAANRLALTGTPIENGVGDLWALLDFTNPGLVGTRSAFVAQMAGETEAALRALNGILVFRRTKSEPVVAAELPDRIDELDHCTMTPEQVGLYQAVIDDLVAATTADDQPRQGAILAAITALKQICNHPAAYQDDGRPLAGRSGKLARLEEIVASVFAAGERILVFTHFASWGRRLADHLTETTGLPISCYDGSLNRATRDRLIAEFQHGDGPGALVLSLKAGGVGLNLTAASHVVLYDRWWNPAVEDQARDRAWRIGQTRTVVSHRLVCPGTVDERVEEVVAGKRHIADLVLPASSSLGDLDPEQLHAALGLRRDALLTEDPA